jgi:hypothetical protein
MAGDILDVQDALVALVQTIDDPNNPGENATAGNTLRACGFKSTDLPFFWVKRGRLISRKQIAAGLNEYVREYPILLYVVEFCNSNDTDADTKQALAAEWVEPFYSALRQHNVTPEGAAYEIIAATDLGDTDVRGIDNAQWFAGQVFILQIKTQRQR